jgi:hypothetical protein
MARYPVRTRSTTGRLQAKKRALRLESASRVPRTTDTETRQVISNAQRGAANYRIARAVLYALTVFVASLGAHAAVLHGVSLTSLTATRST